MEPEFETQFVTAGSLLYSVEHRPWLPPDTQWLFSQSWNDALFAHFAMEPAVLRPLVPDALTLELFDGAAWLTIAPFCTSHLRPNGVPPLPRLSFFPQVNVRTCVTQGRQARGLQFQCGCSQSIGSVVCPGLLPRTLLARGD